MHTLWLRTSFMHLDSFYCMRNDCSIVSVACLPTRQHSLAFSHIFWSFLQRQQVTTVFKSLSALALPFLADASLPAPPMGMSSLCRLVGSAPRGGILSRSICVPDNSRLHSNISDCHPHYVTCITISIISETIPNINLGVINIVAVASEISNTCRGLPPSYLLPETYCCARTHFFHT